MTIGEQIATALQLSHEDDLGVQEVDQDLLSAIEFEVSHSEEEIDNFRQGVFDKLLQFVAETKDERRKEFAEVPDELKLLLHSMHFPLWRLLVTALENTAEGFSDSAVVEAIKHGFPLVGVFPSSGLYASPLEAKGEKMSLDRRWHERGVGSSRIATL